MTQIVLGVLAFATVVLSFAFAALVLVESRRASNAAPAPPAEPQEAAAVPDSGSAALARVLDGVERLATLRDRGALTDKEFAAQKAKTLRQRDAQPQRSVRSR